MSKENKRITGEIMYSPSPGWWLIKDDSGKKHKAASTRFWLIGEKVAVVGDQIIDKAGYGSPARIYKV